MWHLVPPPHLRTLGSEASRDLELRTVDFQTSPFAARITHIFVQNIYIEDLRCLSNFINLTHILVRYIYPLRGMGTLPWDVLVPNALQVRLVLIYPYYLVRTEKKSVGPQVFHNFDVSEGFLPLFTRLLSANKPLDPRFIPVVPERFKKSGRARVKSFSFLSPKRWRCTSGSNVLGHRARKLSGD
ncbi:hypothetical protein DL96DRAFT_600198 [Flagelloscypha sp. PMI_526]|nr:hypothetical protein DL96DRAFT_600198 [Flagelloscypha sp. PMI_526]